ncbi:MAG: undecaprenyldiphospho-muramoylpentapeptide beta-N-acetylglucosaminyltransferase [Legionellales bacterium]|nr:undecaprenyldiphospho-muramoylpentapeptide beta-N-acetylglucosaminyltransferase [Legionellales bacterium]
MSPRIVLTGGGTAGHVTPNIALIEVLQTEGWNIDYVGSADGVECGMMKAKSIPFHAVRSGKLRRYLSWKNLWDPVNILIGIVQSFVLLRQLKPAIVFSKGGFVAFPVVVGAWLNRIPIVAHESDLTPGLANRLSFPFVTHICVTFAAGKQYFKRPEKVIITGTPIREQLLHGVAEKGLNECGFNRDKPCLLVVGGSQGAMAMNRCVRLLLDPLLERFQVIHLCGRGKVDSTLMQKVGYYQKEYADDELGDLFAASDLVISRAGANAVYEILALKKPHILIPLSLKVSRGDQVQNARFFKDQSISGVLSEEDLTPESLLAEIDSVWSKRKEIIQKIEALGIQSATLTIVQLLKEVAHV